MKHACASVAAALAIVATSGAWPAVAAGARITFRVTAPDSTRAGEALWICGDRGELGAWNGAGLRLAPQDARVWTATVALPEGAAFEFKVTRGDWNRVEKDARGGEIANRRAIARDGDTLRVDVAAWRDAFESPAATRASTLTGTVRRHERVPSRFVTPRDVLVWLPPGYDADTTTRYPVVYFLDGQNVFDGATSFIPGGEWGADETADRLIRAGKLPPCLLVAVYNTAARMDEYTSAPDARHGGGRGGAYRRFMVEELKPFIDAVYRTRTESRATGIVGSSLGGLSALDLGLEQPGTFGLVGAVSPSAWWAGGEILRRLARGRGHSGRVWVDIGTAEGAALAPEADSPVAGARRLHAALLARGWRDGADLHYEEVEGAGHNEAAWAARVGRVLQFLLAPR